VCFQRFKIILQSKNVPEKAIKTTGETDVNIAKPNNLINEAGQGVATPSVNETLKKKKDSFSTTCTSC
jgi:hypothetical protein